MDYVRYVQGLIETDLVPNKVNLIFGSRRVGKTFLVRQLLANTAYRTLILEGEDADTHQLLAPRSIAHYQRVLADIDLLVIDEAQAVPAIGQVLKLIVDHVVPIRILVTGSSVFDLANQAGEPLTGRAFIHQLYPLAQRELAPHENALQTQQRLEDRLLYGSFPDVLQAESLAAHERYLRELVNAYLLKDLMTFDGVRNAGKIRDLLRMVAFQIGKEVSMEELARQLQLSRNTIEKYLDLLTKVFVLQRVGGYSRNLRKEVTKSARWYFLDTGIRNALIGDFRPLALRTDVGELWENYLIAERVKTLQAQRRSVDFYFWRTYDQQEIDWLEEENAQLRAYEFKWSQTARIRAPKAFSDAYPDASFSVVSPANYLDFIL